jgi:hypothetical protein
VVEKIKELIHTYDLASKSRDRDKVYQRAYFYSILREQGWHLTKIGKLFNRNHATVINALKIHDAYFKRDKVYMRYINRCDELLNPSIEIPQDTIFQDVMNCHNTTALKLIKDKIMAGGYDKVPTLLFYAPIIFLFFEGTPIKMLVHLSRF